MVGDKTGVVTRINEIEPHAHFAHCHGHSLPSSVGDTIKTIKIMTGALDSAFELSKLIKHSMV